MEADYIWKYKNNKYGWSSHQIGMMYPYWFRFKIKSGVDLIVGDKKTLSGEQLLLLKIYLDELIRSLLKSDYILPSEREITKHNRSFEKIIFEENKYYINSNITNPIGYIIYSMYVFSSILQEAFNEKETICIYKDNISE